MNRDEFKIYVYAAWSSAVAQLTQAATPCKSRPVVPPPDRRHRERLALRAILGRTRRTENSTARAAIAYSEEDQAIFIHSKERSDISGLADPDSARTYFAPGKKLASKFRTFSEAAKPINVRDLLDIDREYLQHDLHCHADVIPFAGQLVIVNDDAITWIRRSEISRPMHRAVAAVEITSGIKIVPEHLRTPMLPWLASVAAKTAKHLEELRAFEFEGMFAELIAAIKEEYNGFPVPVGIDGSGIATPHAFAIGHVCSGHVTTEMLISEARHVAQPMLAKPLLLIIGTETDAGLDEELAKTALEIGGYAAAILLRNDFIGWLSRYPWIWSKYFGDQLSFAVLAPDSDGTILLPKHDANSAVLPTSDPIPRHQIDVGAMTASASICFTGRAGCGKTTATYLLTREFLSKDAIVICGRHGEVIDAQDLPLAMAIAGDVTQRGHRAVIVSEYAAEDTQKSNEQLKELLRLQRHAKGQMLLITSAADEFRSASADVLQRFTLVDVSTGDWQFYERVLQQIAAQSSEPFSVDDALIEQSIRLMQTPREMILAHFSGVGYLLFLTEEPWATRRAQLSLGARVIVDFLATARYFEIERITSSTLRYYVTAIAPKAYDETSVDEAIRELSHKHWIRPLWGEICFPYVRADVFSPSNNGRGSHASEFLHRVLLATKANPSLPAEFRDLFGLVLVRRLYVDHPQRAELFGDSGNNERDY